jgi:hypothetical protein
LKPSMASRPAVHMARSTVSVRLRSLLAILKVGLKGWDRQQKIVIAQRLEATRARHVASNPLLKFGFKSFSQNDEDGIIEEITRRLFGNSQGTFLELGVGNGTENNTLNLLAKGWRGAWLGGEELAFATGNRLTFRKCWLDRENVVKLARELLESHGIADSPDVVSIDLDGNDHHLCSALLGGGFRPALWIAEYNARFSCDTHWVMPYDSTHTWKEDDYFGCSLASMNCLFADHGYKLVACNLTGANAFFVRDDFAELFQDIPEDWRLLFMPPDYQPYPWFGHRPTVRTIESFLSAPALPASSMAAAR